MKKVQLRKKNEDIFVNAEDTKLINLYQKKGYKKVLIKKVKEKINVFNHKTKKFEEVEKEVEGVVLEGLEPDVKQLQKELEEMQKNAISKKTHDLVLKKLDAYKKVSNSIKKELEENLAFENKQLEELENSDKPDQKLIKSNKNKIEKIQTLITDIFELD